MDKESWIKKWLNNELTEEEKKTFEAFDDFEFNERILKAAQYFKASNISKQSGFEDLNKKINSDEEPVKKLNRYKLLFRVAAILVIALGIYFFKFNTGVTSIETLANEKNKIELPDQSKVVLNALSSIEFNKRNWENERNVKLLGEAYFKVEKGRKFQVITDNGIVTVVGTEFNVKQRENYFEVKCFEGIVSVTSGDKTKTLYAGNSFRVINTIVQEKSTTQTQPNWIKNSSSFSEVPYIFVINEFKRQFSTKILLKNIDSNRIFSGGFNHQNIQEALISITKPMGLTFEIVNSNEIIIYGKTN